MDGRSPQPIIDADLSASTAKHAGIWDRLLDIGEGSLIHTKRGWVAEKVLGMLKRGIRSFEAFLNLLHFFLIFQFSIKCLHDQLMHLLHFPEIDSNAEI